MKAEARAPAISAYFFLSAETDNGILVLIFSAAVISVYPHFKSKKNTYLKTIFIIIILLLT